MFDPLKRLWWTIRSFLPGTIHSDSGRIGSGLKEENVIGRLIRRYWWALPIIIGLIYLLVTSDPQIRLPSIQKGGQQLPQQAVAAPTQQDLVIVDACHIVDARTGRRYVAEDCLTFAQKVEGIMSTNPVECIAAWAMWALVWYVIGRLHEKKLQRRSQ